MTALRLALRTLRREWRLAELRTLILALALAVIALGVVATLAARVERGIGASAAELIGGDVGISTPSATPPAMLAKARQRGLRVSRSADFPSVAFANNQTQLLDVTAADHAWPLRGTLEVSDAQGHTRDTHGPATGAVYLDHRAMVALGVKVGDSVQLGGSALKVAAQLVRQPDGGQLVALAPTAIMSLADAKHAGLLGTGSRAKHVLLLAGMPQATASWAQWAGAHLPRGGELITPEKTQQRMRSAFDRAGAFLRLTALLSALLAGVAIALASQRYARRKRDEVALLRALGTPRRRVLALLTWTVTCLALPVALAAALLALGLSEWAWHLAGSLIGDVPTTLPWWPALGAAAMGVAVLVGFALPPLTRLADVPPAAVFRQSLSGRVRRLDGLYLVPLVVALGLIWLQSGSLKLAGILAASLFGVALLAMALSALLLWLAKRLAPGVHPSLRLGLAALTRRRGLSLIQATALSLGLTALLLLSVISPALLNGWRAELPNDTPNWFVLNVQSNQRPDFEQSLKALDAQSLTMAPLAVGKLMAINGTPIDQMQLNNARAKNWADRQLRLSWSGQLPEANKVIAGHWQGPAPAQASVSIDEAWRDMFGLKVGDTMRFQVADTTLETHVSSIRQVNWRSFKVNFFLLLDPAHASVLPHTWIASFYLPSARSTALQSLSRSYPNISLIDVDALLARVRQIIDRVSSAVRWVLGFSLLAGALVLAAALASSAQERRHEAALLRTLGAHGRQLRAAAACEFALLGLVAGLTAAIGAAGAGWWLGQSIFRLHHFVPPLLPLAGYAALAALVVMALGLAGTRAVLRTSPLALLRRG
ncbi:FtsX-like permease family protein [Oleiagrimonas sp. C23AA]|uniref:ABC transporter permease n=1 Tax=Oleiagrimonas sp. C23AA TaxID=2719047 RepID=UPI00141EA206|nr:FtsX-like permease family protein [Oleiagrimonas sp. C23AA]NII11417.1 ABC transporter permease [Oleiagrimonas sp. C23AA]